MACIQMMRTSVTLTAPRRASLGSPARLQSGVRAPITTRRSTVSLPRPISVPSTLRPIRTKPLPSATTSSLIPVPEDSPASHPSVSPTSASSGSMGMFSPPRRSAAHLPRSSVDAHTLRSGGVEAGAGAQGKGKGVFRPAGIAGKGSHRRAKVQPRPQPQRPRFQQFRLRTDAKGALCQAEVAQERARKEAEVAVLANSFRARPAPASLYRGPPVDITRTSPLRRTTLGGGQVAGVGAGVRSRRRV